MDRRAPRRAIAATVPGSIPYSRFAEQRLARELEQHALERRGRLRRGLLGGLLGADCHPATEIRANRATDGAGFLERLAHRLGRLVDPRLVGRGRHLASPRRSACRACRPRSSHARPRASTAPRPCSCRSDARPRGRRRAPRRASPTRAPRTRCASRAAARAPACRPRDRRARRSCSRAGARSPRRRGRRRPRTARGRRSTMFSPSFPMSSSRSSSNRSAAASPSAWTASQHLLGERLELVVLRDRLGLAADADHRARPSSVTM